VPVLEQVLEKYPQDVKVVFKNFPLRNHIFAEKAAIAALGAQSQGKFWELHDLMFKNYSRLNDQTIRNLALGIGISEAQYENMMKDPALQQKVRADFQEGGRAGVRGTPTVFINGIRLRDRTLQGFQTAIDKQLQKRDTASAKPSS